MCVCARTCASTRLRTFVCLCVFMLSECASISQMKPTQAEFLVHRYSCLFYHCAQTHGSLPRKQSPAHSVAFCSISELGETKAACWLHSKPTGTGCFPPEEGGVHIFQPRSRGSHPRHPTGLPEGRHPPRQVAPKHPKMKWPELKGHSCPLWNLGGFREGAQSADHR